MRTSKVTQPPGLSNNIYRRTRIELSNFIFIHISTIKTYYHWGFPPLAYPACVRQHWPVPARFLLSIFNHRKFELFLPNNCISSPLFTEAHKSDRHKLSHQILQFAHERFYPRSRVYKYFVAHFCRHFSRRLPYARHSENSASKNSPKIIWKRRQ